jgi:hypothetical protein
MSLEALEILPRRAGLLGEDGRELLEGPVDGPTRGGEGIHPTARSAQAGQSFGEAALFAEKRRQVAAGGSEAR